MMGGNVKAWLIRSKFGSASYSFMAGFAAAMLGALWGYDGWNNLALVAGEVKNPERNIPLALIGGTDWIIVLYVFVHIAYFYVLDPTTIASVSKDSSVAKEVVARFFGGDIKSFCHRICGFDFYGWFDAFVNRDASHFDFVRRTFSIRDGKRRFDVQINGQTFGKNSSSGHFIDCAGNLGVSFGTFGFV